MKACFPTTGNSGIQLLCNVNVRVSTLPFFFFFFFEVKELDTVQKLAAHWIHHHYCQTSSVGLMNQFPNWPSLQECRVRYRLWNCWKFHDNLITSVNT